MISTGAVRTVAPAALPVSLTELKAQLRYTQSEEDAILYQHLASAVEACENYASLGMMPQTWRETFPGFPSGLASSWSSMAYLSSGPLKLRMRPVQSVLSIGYIDSSGADQVFDPALYRLTGAGTDKAADAAPAVALMSGVWPTVISGFDHLEKVTVTYAVGYGDNHNAVPEKVRHAVLMAGATFFEWRNDLAAANLAAELPISSKALLRDYRRIALA